MGEPVTIRHLPTGIPGLDSLLGGGLPEFSFNIIAGMPGSGKTTLAYQLMFSQASPDCRALYFTVLGESSLKMLRYQQQFSFFDSEKLTDSIRLVNLSTEIIDGNFEGVLERILEEVKNYSPSLVFVDSFRSVIQMAKSMERGQFLLQHFVQRLAMHMSSWQATSFLIGEYLASEADIDPVFTVADSILWLSQSISNNAMVRKMQVVKIRGQAQVPGWHSFRISDAGIRVFPRAALGQPGKSGSNQKKSSQARLSMGTPVLDEMLGGGLPCGHSLLVVGPSGSGKTMLATEFLAEGARQGESSLIAAFERSPRQLLSSKLEELINEGHVHVINTRLLDLSIDELLHDLIDSIHEHQVKRVVIDSLTGLELAVAPEFRDGFRSEIYRMVGVLTDLGVTILMTSELEDRYTDLRFSSYGNAFLADAIIMHRYIEVAGELKRVISVVKVRGSDHSKTLRLFDVSDEGPIIGEALVQYEGILSGSPTIRIELQRDDPKDPAK